jgi:hypothetical protein
LGGIINTHKHTNLLFKNYIKRNFYKDIRKIYRHFIDSNFTCRGCDNFFIFNIIKKTEVIDIWQFLILYIFEWTWKLILQKQCELTDAHTDRQTHNCVLLYVIT